MATIVGLSAALFVFLGMLFAQDSVSSCPMDPDVDPNQPGVCKRCGMKMVARCAGPRWSITSDLHRAPRAAPKDGDNRRGWRFEVPRSVEEFETE